MTEQYQKVDASWVDDEHDELLNLFNALFEQIERNALREPFMEGLHQLISLSEQHFETENQLMLESAFPERPTHMAQHEEFLKYLVRTVKDWGDDGKLHDGDRYELHYLFHRFTNHLMTYDQRLDQFLARHNVKHPGELLLNAAPVAV